MDDGGLERIDGGGYDTSEAEEDEEDDEAKEDSENMDGVSVRVRVRGGNATTNWSAMDESEESRLWGKEERLEEYGSCCCLWWMRSSLRGAKGRRSERE